MRALALANDKVVRGTPHHDGGGGRRRHEGLAPLGRHSRSTLRPLCMRFTHRDLKNLQDLVDIVMDEGRRPTALLSGKPKVENMSSASEQRYCIGTDHRFLPTRRWHVLSLVETLGFQSKDSTIPSDTTR